MLHRKYTTIEEYKNSTQKDEFEYLYRKDDGLKGNENENTIEYGMIFLNVNLFILNEVNNKKTISLL